MAARAKYPASHEQLSALARLARLEGLSFEEFWARAVRPEERPVTWASAPGDRPGGCVVWPRDTTDRNISIAATLGARDGWRRAYEGLTPTRQEAALSVIRPALEALAEVAEERQEQETRQLEAAAA